MFINNETRESITQPIHPAAGLASHVIPTSDDERHTTPSYGLIEYHRLLANLRLAVLETARTLVDV